MCKIIVGKSGRPGRGTHPDRWRGGLNIRDFGGRSFEKREDAS